MLDRHISRGSLRLVLGLGAVILTAAGCWTNPSPHTISRNYNQRPFPSDPPPESGGTKFDERTNGGELFKMYCGACHHARPLSERPFANYEVAVAHMREQAALTGNEYRQIIHFLRRWHDVGPPTPDVEPSPKRFYFSQPINELRKQSPGKGAPPREKPAEENGAPAEQP